MINLQLDNFYPESIEGFLTELNIKNYKEGIIDYKGKQVLVLFLEDPLFGKAMKLFDLIDKHNNLDGVILYNPSEVIDLTIVKLFYHVCKKKKIDHIAIHDPRFYEGNEINFSYGDSNVQVPIITNTVLGLIISNTLDENNLEDHNTHDINWKILNAKKEENNIRHDKLYYYLRHDALPPQERDVLFTCYNRQPRTNRVLLVNEICRQGLKDKGVISCGYHEANFKYYKDIVDKEFLHLFPMQLEDDYVYSNAITNDTVCNQSITQEQLKSFINVVSESSSDCNILPTVDGWKTKFLTEKTAKAFICFNIPLFYSTLGFVEDLRNIGFDVYDDFIDHSYDKEINPIRRVEMITKELKRLTDLSVSELQDIIEGLTHRMQSNRTNLLHYINDLDIKKCKGFKNYFDGLASNK
jgi:hypothetical protein